MNKKYKKVSKFLSYVLRHNPAKIEIERDRFGWVDVSHLLEKLNIDLELLEEIVETDTKTRYSFNADKSRIKANYGHSGDVETECLPNQPPQFLYHGTKLNFLENIKKEGISKMKRTGVHLSETVETAQIVADRRTGTSVILRIRALEMYMEGHRFVKCTDDLWLVNHIDIHFIDYKWTT